MIILTLNRGAGYALYRMLLHLSNDPFVERAVDGEYKMTLTLSTQAQFNLCRLWLDQYPQKFENASVVRRMFGQ